MSYYATPTAAIGSTIAWSGTTAGLLAFAALLLMQHRHPHALEPP